MINQQKILIKHFKQRKKSYLRAVILVVITMLVVSNAMAFWKKDDGKFKFKDYLKEKTAEKNAEATKVALLAMHPVGSSVNALIKTLEKSGSECRNISINQEGNHSEYPNKIYYMCSVSGFITRTDWNIEIFQNYNLIQDVKITIYYTGL